MSIILSPLTTSHNRRTPPRHFYRVQHENSWTTSPRADSDAEKAFKTEAEFDWTRDLTKDRIERHLYWFGSWSEPTTYISVYETFERAEDRVHYQFHKVQPKYRARCLVISEIAATNLIPAEFVAENQLRIPIWLDIDVKTPMSAQTTMWVSLAEVRSLFNIPRIKGQDDEWLACGHIYRKRVVRVMPFDGERVHRKQDYGVKVICSDDPEEHVFDWETQAWVDCETYKANKLEKFLQGLSRTIKMLERIANTADVEGNNTASKVP